MLQSAEQAMLATVVRGLEAAHGDLVERIAESILAGERVYAESNRLTSEQMRRIVSDNLAAVFARLGGDPSGRYDIAHATGRLKAEQNIPVAALLHAYRMSGLIVWEHVVEQSGSDPQLRSALPRLASQMWGIIDEFSSVAAVAHGEATAEHARSDTATRERLLSELLSGAAVDSERLWDILRAFRLPSSGTFVVVSAENSDHNGDPLPRAEEQLRSNGLSSVWAWEVEAKVGLLSLPPAGDEPALHALAELASARVGVSRSFENPLAAAGALREAQLACRCAAPGATAVTRYGDAPLPLFVAQLPVASRELVGQVLGPLLQLPATERETLFGTLEAWYSHGGSSPRAAGSLHCHRNTVLYRLRRIDQLTGLSVADPAQGAELYLALRAARLVGFPPQTPASP